LTVNTVVYMMGAVWKCNMNLHMLNQYNAALVF